MNILFFKGRYDKIGKIEAQEVEGGLRNEIDNVEGQMMIKIYRPNQRTLGWIQMK